MKPQVITLFEHQSKTYQELGWRPDDERINRLEQLVQDTQTPIFSVGRHSLKANQYIGVIRLGSLTIQILPKIDYEGSSEELREGEVRQKAVQTATSNLLSMLSYTHDLQLRARDLAALKEQPSDWFELLTRLYASELHAQLRSGLEHAYVHYEDSLPVIRGRWQISRQLATHPHLPHRFDVAFDEFSPDTPLNQVFRYVTNRLLPITIDMQNRRYLQDIRDWLDEVPPAGVLIEALLHQVHFSRLNERFRPAYNLARLFLESLAFQLSAGDHEVFAFVLNMNRLFEEFVGRFLVQHWKTIEPRLFPELKVILQSRGKRVYLAENLASVVKPMIPLIPDIQFTSVSGQPRLIGDTKYKQLTQKGQHLGVAEGDLYQMLAYSIRLDCPRLLLLYPQSNTGRVRAVLKVQDQPQTVKIATLNLHTPLSTPLHLIEELQEILYPFIAD